MGNKEMDKIIKNKFRLSISLGVIFLTTVLSLPILNEYAKNFMQISFGNFSIAYIYVAIFIYLISWGLTLIYVKKTNEMEERN